MESPAHITGIRNYDRPEQPQAYMAKNEYMFGEQMPLAPVTQPVDSKSQLEREKVWLPPGHWIEWQSGTHLRGPILLNRKFSIQQIPVYVRAGSIIPMYIPGANAEQSRRGPLVLTIFPSSFGKERSYTLYEDSGTGTQYRNGEAAWTSIHAQKTTGDLVIRVDAVHGGFVGIPITRSLRVQLPDDWPPDRVTVNGRTLRYNRTGKPASWMYNGNSLETILTLPSNPTSRRVTILIHRQAALVKRRTELNRFAGAITRHEGTYNALNVWPLTWSPDKLAIAMQAGDRMSYAPGTCFAEMARFPQEMAAAEDAVRDMRRAFTQHDLESMAADAASPGGSWIDRLQLQESRQYENYIDHALALMQSITTAPETSVAVQGRRTE